MRFGVVCTLIDNDARHHSGHDANYLLPQYQRQRKRFSLKKALRDKLTQAGFSGLFRQRQISQSDCEISSNCDEIHYWDNYFHQGGR